MSDSLGPSVWSLDPSEATPAQKTLLCASRKNHRLAGQNPSPRTQRRRLLTPPPHHTVPLSPNSSQCCVARGCLPLSVARRCLSAGLAVDPACLEFCFGPGASLLNELPRAFVCSLLLPLRSRAAAVRSMLLLVTRRLPNGPRFAS